MAPEVVSGNALYDYKTDIFSFGVILYLISHPENKLPTLIEVCQEKYASIPSASEHMNELIKAMIQLDPDMRPDINQVLLEL